MSQLHRKLAPAGPEHDCPDPKGWLSAAGLYKPIQDYDRETLAKDLTAHLVYGTITAAALRLLSPLTRHPRHG
jgi:hypothetical protein